MRRILLTLLLLLALPLVASSVVRAATIADYAGVYVGGAVDLPAGDGFAEERDLEVIIRIVDGGGFVVEWLNVTRVDGRRDVPGVRRIQGRAQFERKNDSFFVEKRAYDPFSQAEELTPMHGDAVRWAVLDDNGLNILSFAVMDDGAYELQQTLRRRTETGLDIEYTRIGDGALRRHMRGRAVEVKTEASP